MERAWFSASKLYSTFFFNSEKYFFWDRSKKKFGKFSEKKSKNPYWKNIFLKSWGLWNFKTVYYIFTRTSPAGHGGPEGRWNQDTTSPNPILQSWKPYKEFWESRFTISGIRVWTAPIVLWHSKPARILAWIIPERSQASRTPRSAFPRFAILAISPFLTAEMDLGGIFIRVGRAFWVAEVLLWCMATSQKFSGDPKVSEQSPSRASTDIESVI